MSTIIISSSGGDDVGLVADLDGMLPLDQEEEMVIDEPLVPIDDINVDIDDNIEENTVADEEDYELMVEVRRRDAEIVGLQADIDERDTELEALRERVIHQRSEVEEWKRRFLFMRELKQTAENHLTPARRRMYDRDVTSLQDTWLRVGGITRDRTTGRVVNNFEF
jgi:hypothetical protein